MIPALLASAFGGIAGKLLDRGSDKVASQVGDKVFGVPTPEVGPDASRQGVDLRDFMDSAYPGTTPWERLGGSGGSSYGAVESADIGARLQERLQSRELRNRSEIAEGNNTATVAAAASPLGAQAVRNVLDVMHGIGPRGRGYDTHTRQQRELMPSQKRKLRGEADRSDIVGKAAGGIGRTFAAAGRGAGRFSHRASESLKGARDRLSGPLPRVARIAGDFVGRNEGKVRDFLHNRGKRPSRFGIK